MGHFISDVVKLRVDVLYLHASGMLLTPLYSPYILRLNSAKTAPCLEEIIMTVATKQDYVGGVRANSRFYWFTSYSIVDTLFLMIQEPSCVSKVVRETNNPWNKETHKNVGKLRKGKNDIKKWSPKRMIEYTKHNNLVMFQSGLFLPYICLTKNPFPKIALLYNLTFFLEE